VSLGAARKHGLRLTALLAIAWAPSACGGRVARAPSETPLSARTSTARASGRPLSTVASAGSATVVIGGADAARGALYDLLAALLDDDADAMRRLLAEETVSVHAFRVDQRAPRALPLSRREIVIQRMLAAHRVSRLAPDASLAGIVDPSRVEVVPAETFFSRSIPVGLRAGDLVVRFSVHEDAERALLSIASRGRGLLVVRVAPDGASIVGL